MRTLSATKLNTYLLCPRLFHETYIDSEYEATRTNIYVLRGQAIHKVMQVFCQEGSVHVESPVQMYQRELGERVQSALAQGLKIEGLPYYLSALKFGKKVFTKKFSFDKYNGVVEREHWFSLPYPNKDLPICIVRGILDQIYPWGIVDFKTNKEKPTEEQVSADPQFILYAWVFTQLYGREPDYVYFDHLLSGTWVKAEIDVARYAELDDLIHRILADTEYLSKVATTGEHCTYCPHHSECSESG